MASTAQPVEASAIEVNMGREESSGTDGEEVHGKREFSLSTAESKTTESKMESKGPAWPLWKLILMAVPQFGVQVLWCFTGPTATPYMIYLGAGPALATVNNIAGPITGFFTGPIVGAWSDNLTSKWGRRRPIILLGLVSTWVAGMLFASAGQIFSGEAARISFAVVMYLLLGVMINILQTPYRALVSDLASTEQQLPMQVVFVVMMAAGNFIGYLIMRIWEVPVAHMWELMLMICAMNTVCIGIQFAVAREVQFVRPAGAPTGRFCGVIVDILRSVRGMPRLLYHLALVQCLVWTGNTAWTYYGAQWMANTVFDGSLKMPDGSDYPDGSPEKVRYGEGMQAFSLGGLYRSGLQLLSAMVIIALLLLTAVRPRLVYAPCIFIGAVVSLLGAFVVGHSGVFAIICLTLSIMPESGSFAIPFGLVATLNKRAEEEGKQVSTALQMSLLNCCITVGQQVCHLVLSMVYWIEPEISLAAALPCVLILAGVTQTLGGGLALFLNDKPEPKGKASEVQV